MIRHAAFPLILAVGLMLSGCGSSTHFTQVWKDDALTQWTFKKVAVAAISPNESIRRTGESQMAASVRAHGVEAEGVSSLMPIEKLKDKDFVQQKLSENNFDALITMRLVAADAKTSYVPGTVTSFPTSYYSPWGYYGYGWQSVYEPGYMVTNTYVNIETNIYSIKDEKLVWSGMSQSVDPSSAQKLVEEISQEAYYEMQKQGIVK
jgi:hypothetical protein